MANKQVELAYTHWKPLSQSDFNRIMLDFENYCLEGSMVINKNGQSVPMQLNEAQLAVSRLMIPKIFAVIPSPVNFYIHKSRQMGITTVFMKLEQYCGTRLRNFNMQHFMPTEPDADEISEKKFMPILQGVHPDIAPITTWVARKYKFKQFGEVKLSSSVNFTSAMSIGAGRGQTNQWVLLDEYAYYTKVRHLERGVMATVPKAGLGIKIYSSTANGMNHFADLGKVAQENPNEWDYLFLPWHMLAEYEMQPEGRLKELTALTEYEVFLCNEFEKAGYPVTSWARKLQWYQFTLTTEAKNDQDYMFEAYPTTPEESFQATGTPVLPSKILLALKEVQQSFEYIELLQGDNNQVEIINAIQSSIKRFKLPVAGHKYAIWADPADGGAANDTSGAVVVDLNTMESVCCIKERLDQNDFAEVLAVLGRYYNLAEIVVERNTGQSCIDWLVKILRYPRMRVDPLHTTDNRVEYGVYMTRPIKNEAIMRLKFLLNNGFYKDFDPDFLDEGLHFSWTKTPSGFAKAEGTDGWHDDSVMARLNGVASLDMRRWKDYKQYRERQLHGKKNTN